MAGGTSRGCPLATVRFSTVPSFPIMTLRRTTPEMRACLASGGYSGAGCCNNLACCTLPPTRMRCGGAPAAPATPTDIGPGEVGEGADRILSCGEFSPCGWLAWAIAWDDLLIEPSICCSGTLSEIFVTFPSAVTFKFCNSATSDAASPFGTLACAMLGNDFSTTTSAEASTSVFETTCTLATTLAPNFTPPLACCKLPIIANAPIPSGPAPGDVPPGDCGCN